MTDHEQIATADQVIFGDDFMSHRITGYVHQASDGNGYISVPLVSHVTGNLYQGGCIPGVKLPAEFKHVFSLYPWGQYDLAEGTKRVEVEMYDSLDQGFEQIDELAEQVKAALLDGPTLVHCQAGMNRSGLLAARTLMLKGFTAAEAIKLLRVKRPSQYVLSNQAFENYLLGLDS